MIKYSLVIPFYNEEKNIKLVLIRLKKILKFYNKIEFIIVNNGSTDNSSYILKKILSKYKSRNFKYVLVKKNMGYGYGIKMGLKKTVGKYLAWTHADMQTDPMDIIKGINLIKRKKINNIFIKGKRTNRKFMESIQSYCMECLSSLLLGQKLTDINAQPKIFDRKFYIKYIKKHAPNDLSLDLFTYYFAKKNTKIYEINVKFRKRFSGETKGAGEGGSVLNKFKVVAMTIKCIILLRVLSLKI